MRQPNSHHFHNGKSARAANKPCVISDARMTPESRQLWYDGWNHQDALMRPAPTQAEIDDTANFLQALKASIMNTPTPTPKEQAIQLLADLATAQADLRTAIAPHEAEAIRIQAAITKATAKEKARIDELEERLKALALDHSAEIFGAERSSLIENGLRLLVTESEAVELLDDEENICRRLQRDLQAAKEPHERLALSSLLTIKLAINKRYVLENYDKAPEWFEHYNLGIEEKKNASVKPAPKPRTAKAKTSKKTPAEATPEQEAA